MAAVLAWLKHSGCAGMTESELARRTALGKNVKRAIHHLQNEGWVTRQGDMGKFVITPDQRDRFC